MSFAFPRAVSTKGHGCKADLPTGDRFVEVIHNALGILVDVSHQTCSSLGRTAPDDSQDYQDN
jgi:hypothetical protein